MATIKFSGIGITEMRGSIGGTVLTRNTAGAIARIKVNPVFPNTAYQQAQNNAFATVTEFWRTLTQEQQDAWIAAAELPEWEYINKVGEAAKYSGQQLFSHLNLSTFNYSYPLLEPPTKPSLSSPSIIGLHAATEEGENLQLAIGFDGSTIPSNQTMFFFATPPMSTGINRPKRKLFRLIQKTVGDDFTNSVDLLTAWASRFGTLIPGLKLFVYVELLDNESGVRLIVGQAVTVITAE